jgi:hypothetical protein
MKEVVMDQIVNKPAANKPTAKKPAASFIAIKHVAVLAALIVTTAAHAASYDYVEHYTYIGKPALSDAQIDSQLQVATVACDDAVGGQNGAPTARYRSCMLQQSWKYSSLTRTRVQTIRAPGDPYFSSNAKVAPGHFIDHDNGMDCQNMGGAEVCDPPQGTVHYFDPDQNLPCTRTGAMSICSNM